MFFSILYEISLVLVGLATLPKILYMRLVHKKYKHSLFRKFGNGFPIIEKGDRPLIWIHAVSVGETKVAASLVKRLKVENKNSLIVVSSVTETGHAEAQRAIPSADFHVYFPFDFSWVIKPIVKRVNPDLVILCESDFWYNFLSTAKGQGAKIALINGKISERSLKRFQATPFFSKRLFDQIDLFCIQNKHYMERFEALQLPVEKKRLITGNMKFDDACISLSADQLRDWREQLGVKSSDQIIVVGSSHDPEEKNLLKSLQELWKKFPDLKAILVPRHPERFNEVANLLQKQAIPFQRFTAINKQAGAKVILMDTMGLLRKCYQLADIAIVGGSFTSKVGGHNILEPSWFGVPVLFGPFMHQQPELVELVQEYGSGQQVKFEECTPVIESLLKDQESRQKIGKAGLKMVGELHGATEKTFEAINSLISKNK
jgi:3-deoxy-D-manno-octulosonic-acid transferase